MKKLREIYFLKTNRYNHAIHVLMHELEDNLLEKYNMEITFSDMKILKKNEYFNDFIEATLRFFMDYTKGNRPEPIYIPSQAEIISLDDGFIDAYYDSKFASEKDEVLHLTEGFDISKSIITYNIEMPNIIELRFNSMYCKNERNILNSIWQVNRGEVKESFRESLLSKLQIREPN